MVFAGCYCSRLDPFFVVCCSVAVFYFSNKQAQTGSFRSYFELSLLFATFDSAPFELAASAFVVRYLALVTLPPL